MTRSVEQFVRESYDKGRKPKHIRAVAKSSVWKNQMDEVNMFIEEIKEERKHSKKFKAKKIKIRKRST